MTAVFKLFASAALVSSFLCVGSAWASPSKSAEQSLAQLGMETIRSASYDLCLPARAEEYEALGKHAILRIEARSAIATELPLKAVYVAVGGIPVAFRRIILLDKWEGRDPSEEKSTSWHQVSFYLVPLNLLKDAPALLVDFTGQRTGFGIGKIQFGPGAPSFVRLDEYDTPSEPSSDAINEILRREYPDDFRGD